MTKISKSVQYFYNISNLTYKYCTITVKTFRHPVLRFRTLSLLQYILIIHITIKFTFTPMIVILHYSLFMLNAWPGPYKLNSNI